MSPVPADVRNPFVGPVPFGETDPIYGRERELPRLFDILVAQRIVLLYSPSGAGKTSLIEAKNGLRSMFAGSRFTLWPTISVKFGDEPNASGTPRGANRYVSSVLQSLEREPGGNGRAPSRKRRAEDLPAFFAALDKSSEKRLDVLIFDQFEQIFTVDPTDQEARFAFFTQVGEVLHNPRRWALFSMREDYIAGLDPYLRLIPNQLRTTYRLDVLDPAAARQAIQRPAEDGGVPFTDPAAAALVENLRITNVQGPDGRIEGRAGPWVEPLILQVVCRGLWQDLVVGQGKPRIAEEDVAPEADEAAEDDRPQVDVVDQKLIAYFEDGLRQVLDRPEVREAGVDERDLRLWFDGELITKQDVRPQLLLGNDRVGSLPVVAVWPLVDEHIVRKDDRRGLTWFELAHDRLIRPIRQSNAAWFAANLGPLELQAKAWEKNGFADGFLLAGDALRGAVNLREKHPDQLSELETKFVDQSHAFAMERAGEKKNRILAAVLVVFLVAASILIYLWHSATEASRTAQRIASSRHVAAQAMRVLPDQLDLALLLGVAANKEVPTGDSMASLYAALMASPRLDKFIPTDISRASAIATSPDGQTLAIGGCQTTTTIGACTQPIIVLWHLTPLGELIQPKLLEPTDLRDVAAIAYSTDGGYLAAAGGGGLVLFGPPDSEPQKLETGETHSSCDSPDMVSVAFRPASSMVVAGTRDGCIAIWEVKGGQDVRWLRWLTSGDQDAVQSLAFGRGGEVLAAGSSGGAVRLWDPDGGLSVQPPIAEHQGGVNAVAFNREGSILASGGQDGQIILTDVTDDGQSQVRTDPGRPVLALAFSPVADLLASCGEGFNVRLWADVSPARLREGTVPTPEVLTSADEADTDLNDEVMRALTFTRDGVTLVSMGEDRLLGVNTPRSIAILWNATDREPLGQPVRKIDAVGTGSLIALSADGALLATTDGTRVVIRNLQTDVTEGSIDLDRGTKLRSLALSDKEHGLLATGTTDGMVTIWSLPEGGAETTPKQRTSWKLTADEGRLSSMALTNDGTVLAIGTEPNKTYLWDVATSGQRGEITVRSKTVQSIAFDRNGALLAIGGGDGMIQIWDIAADQARGASLIRHGGGIRSLAFSPNDMWLASAGDDGVLLLWDRESQLSLEPPLAKRAGERWHVAFLADDLLVSFAASQSEVSHWDVSLQGWMERACLAANRRLDPDEWRRYVSIDRDADETICLSTGADDELATPTRGEEQ